MSLPASGAADSAVTDGFVLAGGRSSRMGQDKALVKLGGVPLVEHGLKILRAALPEVRIAGARSDLSRYAPSLPDDPDSPGLGPLSGICPALAASTAPLAAFIPVDLPFLPSELVSYLVRHAQVTGSAITITSIGGFIETFPVVIDRDASPTLKARLQSEDRGCLKAFQAAAEATRRPFKVVPVELLVQAGQIRHPHGLPAHDWFLSINTPNDLVRAEDLLGRYFIS